MTNREHLYTWRGSREKPVYPDLKPVLPVFLLAFELAMFDPEKYENSGTQDTVII